MIKKIYLAKPRGFCAGVKRAVEIVNLVLKKYGAPLYVRHQIVHNRQVVLDFEKKGVIFVEDLKEVPDKGTVIFSAHGSPPAVYREAQKRQLRFFDACCPLVTKVHQEAKKYAKMGYYIFYIGHKKHPEPIGVLGEISPKSVTLIETSAQAREVNPPQREKLIVLTQTTLSLDDTDEIIQILQQRFPKLIKPPTSDICFSTQNRQTAVKELAKNVQLILVVGSAESSNSQRLREVAEKSGAKAYLIDDVSQINKSWLEGVEILGISAGASAPEDLINGIVNYFRKPGIATKELEVVHENISFPLPKEVYESE